MRAVFDLAQPKTWLSLSLLLTGAGALLPEGFWLCLPAFALALAALRRPPAQAPRGLSWVALWAAALVLLTVFTVRVAVPNIVSAGNSANHGLAASTLRTLLWAEDQLVAKAGRVGTLGELAGRVPVAGAPPLEVPLLRAELAPLAAGVSVFSGYAYRIYVEGEGGEPATDGQGRPRAGARHFLAYAWPVLPGKSGLSLYCLNEHEDIFQAQVAARPEPYSGLQRQPAWNACLAPGAKLGDRPVEGVGADGARWTRWKGRPTRRAKQGEAPTSTP